MDVACGDDGELTCVERRVYKYCYYLYTLVERGTDSEDLVYEMSM